MATKIVMLCDACGREGEWGDFTDGGELKWMIGEEAEFSISFKELCDQCAQLDFDYEALDEVFDVLRKLFPYADITEGPARAASGA